MIVLRDEKRIAQLARIGQIVSLVGLLALVAGLLFIFLGENPYPVSYTHLDVYKRQSRCRS